MIAAGEGNARLLTIISVAYPDEVFLLKNLELTEALNPGFTNRWIVVDNTPGSSVSIAAANVSVLQGVARPVSRDSGSFHHALALEKALGEVRTRFVLLLDHDFYVLREEWINTVVSHVRRHEIGLFGSVWNPRWFYQYRDFPSVHFMLIDLDRVPVTQIELKPSISRDRWWQIINRRKTPLPAFLRDTFKAQRCRDTGWRLRRRFLRDPSIRVETLLPHYVPPDTTRFRGERKLGALLPMSWRKYPPIGRGYSEKSFLNEMWPEAYREGWEEFFWEGSPFAVHLRRVGRSVMLPPVAADDTLIEDLVRRMADRERR